MGTEDEDTAPNGMMIRLDTVFHEEAAAIAAEESKRTGYRITKTDIFRKALAAGFKHLRERGGL